jgi:hypothetical protein
MNSPIARACGPVNKVGVYVGYGNALGSLGNFRDLVSSAHLAFLEDAEIEAGPVMTHEESGHSRLVHSGSHAVTGHAWLHYFEERATNPVAIAYAHLVIGQAVDCKIFAKLPEHKNRRGQGEPPSSDRGCLVPHDRAMLSSVSGKISLSVAKNVQTADHHSTLHRLLPDTGVYRLSPPCNVSGNSYVD